ncbi:MAG: hypothetical protein RBS24_06110 [Bacilli bacterium]|nr:hypothetical protein [Bacilli bacterium]
MEDKENKRIDLKEAIKSKSTAPQGTLAEIEAQNAPKTSRNAPRKRPEDKIAQKIAVGFTQAEYDAIEAKANVLAKTMVGVTVAPSTIIKMAVLEYLKNN